MRARLERLLGTDVARVRDLGTSHAWTLHRASLADGREVFVKAAAPSGRASPEDVPPGGVFAAEAAGLRRLVHVALFGGSYRASLLDAARAAAAALG